MKDNKKIEAAKKLIELMQAYVNGEDIEKLIDGKYITITESDSIEFICIYNISKYRIKPKYRPCTKDEFINLMLKDVEHMTLISTTTGKLYYINSIKDDNIILVHNEEISSFNYNELFENYVFYNRFNPIIGVENK